MKEKNPNILDLKEKIYFICYPKPLYTKEIAKIIYGEDKQRYAKINAKQGILSEMLKKGYINPVKIDSVELQTTDKRAKKRKYYLSTINPVFENINNFLLSKKIRLNTIEQEQIRELLNSDEFRSMIGFYYPPKPLFTEAKNKQVAINPLSIITYIFLYHCGIFYALRELIDNNKKISKKRFLIHWDSLSNNDTFKKNLIERFNEMDNKKQFEASLRAKHMNFEEALHLNDFARKFFDLDIDLLKKLLNSDSHFRHNPNLIITLFNLSKFLAES